MRQVVRQLQVLRTLQANRFGTSVRQLADELATTPRTIQRDLNDLRDAEFIITAETRDDQHVYYRLAGPGLPLNLPITEIAAMVFAERAGLGLVGTPFGDDLSSGIRRLTKDLPRELRAFLERAADAYVPLIRGQKSYDDAREIVERLNEAILERRVCRVSYRKVGDAEAKAYDLEPLRILHHRGGLYVISRMPYYDQLITHAVERFEKVEVTETGFEPPDHLPVDERLRDAFGVSYEEPMDVVVRFTKEQAPYVRERVWHPSQELEELPDGRVVLRLRAGGMFELKSWVLSFGAAAEVLEPEELREEIRRESIRMVDRHVE